MRFMPAILVLICGGTFVLSGCDLGPKRIGGTTKTDVVLDDLRRENMTLAEQVSQLQAKLAQRSAELEAIENRASTTQPAMQGVKASDLPRLAGLKFDRYSGPIDTGSDGTDDTVNLYLRPIDQRGRTLSVTGQAVMQVYAMPDKAAPSLLVEKTWTPTPFDESYRSGLTGTHYTLSLPLPQPLPAGVAQVLVKVTLTDAASGLTFTQEQMFSLTQP